MIERRKEPTLNKYETEYAQHKFEMFRKITYWATLVLAIMLSVIIIFDFKYAENIWISMVLRFLPLLAVVSIVYIKHTNYDRINMCHAIFVELITCDLSFSLLMTIRTKIFNDLGHSQSPFMICIYILIAVTILFVDLSTVTRKTIWLYGINCICAIITVAINDLPFSVLATAFFILPLTINFVILGYMYDKMVRREFNMKKELEHKMYHDALTGLYNRNIFSKITTNDYFPSNKYSIIMIDIDFFKRVNDKYSHEKGDEILERLGKVMNAIVRESDYAIRWGGEELIILLATRDEEVVKQVAKRLVESFDEANANDEDGCKPTLSIGCCICVNNYKYEQNIDIADSALYYVKRNGRNNIAIVNSNDINFIDE